MPPLLYCFNAHIGRSRAAAFVNSSWCAICGRHPATSHAQLSSTAYPIQSSPDVVAAIARALGHNNDNQPQGTAVPSQPLAPMRKYFSKAITNATSDLPISVIKELKVGFKNYIPLALCTHKACVNATRMTDTYDTEIGWTDKGEMRLKQKSMSAAKDHYLTTNDFTEIRENFVRGMRKYLVMCGMIPMA